MKIHLLKTWPSYYAAILDRRKKFEVRFNDRDFAVGDFLHLLEYDPGKDAPIDAWKYTGREMRLPVTFMLSGGQFGIEKGVCVMSLGEPVEIPDGGIEWQRKKAAFL